MIIFPSGALWAHSAPRACPLALLCADIWWLSSHSSCSGRKGAAASCTPHHFQQSRSKDCAARLRSILQSPLQQLLTGSSREVCRGWKIWVAIEVLSYAFSLFPGLFHSFFLFRKDLTEQGCSGGNLFFSRETHCDSHSHLIISQCNTSVCFLLALTPFYESHHLGALSLFLLPHFRLRKLHHINLISWGSSVSADLL